MKKNNPEKKPLGDISWLFMVMAGCFGAKWAKLYPPKNRKTRVLKDLQKEWGRAIYGFSRDEILSAVDEAKAANIHPPSATDFWKILDMARIKNRRARQQQIINDPPDKKLGARMLQDTKVFLEHRTTKGE